MKDSPVLPGGSSRSKPTFGDISTCSPTSAFSELLAMRHEREHHECQGLGILQRTIEWQFGLKRHRLG